MLFFAGKQFIQFISPLRKFAIVPPVLVVAVSFYLFLLRWHKRARASSGAKEHYNPVG